MKKIVVLFAAMMLLAGAAFAGISGTKHDLSNGGAGSDEICVYCHTPHGAGAVGFAPLWNRTTANATDVYNSATLNATITLGGVNTSDAPLCLSCHDGASLDTALNNPPNAAASDPGTTLTDITGDANLGTALANDHPVGFDYAAVVSADAEIQAQSTLPLYNGDMWCSTCHDVHDNTDTPFLQQANGGSALCLVCHVK